jgi:hypothetical protein
MPERSIAASLQEGRQHRASHDSYGQDQQGDPLAGADVGKAERQQA